MRFSLFFSALALLSTSSSNEHIRRILGPDAPMRATRVALSPSDPSIVRAGALVYLGGLQLSSGDRAFGGFSAIEVDGDRFMLLSDAGNIVRFRMVSDLRPFALAYGDLVQGPGTGWSKWDRDSESLTRDPVSGRVWIGFERYNAIWRYDAALQRAERHAQPAEMADWFVGGGPEAMVRLRSGAFLVFRNSPAAGAARRSGGAAIRRRPDRTRSAAAALRLRPAPRL